MAGADRQIFLVSLIQEVQFGAVLLVINPLCSRFEAENTDLLLG